MRIRAKSSKQYLTENFIYDWVTDSSPQTGAEFFYQYMEDKEVRDESHGRNWASRSGDCGGPFYRWHRHTTRIPSESATLFRPNGIGSNRGKMFSGTLTARPELMPAFQDAESVANANSATLWNRAKPAKPLLNGFASIYELREIPGALKQRFEFGKHPLKSIGSTFLAEKFGWEPLLKDVRDFVLTHFAAKRYLDQLIRDEGKPVRRKAGMPRYLRDYGISVYPDHFDAFEQTFVTQAYARAPSGTYHWTEGYDVWFEARFRYWLPPGPRDWRWTTRMLASIFGIYPTPSQVYKVIPWSWLVDWFSNVGDVIDNMSGGVESRLSADYAYVMCHKWAQRDSIAEGRFFTENSFDGAQKTLRASSTVFTDTKVRVQASPFGFSLKDNELSWMQHAILGALGLSRLRA